MTFSAVSVQQGDMKSSTSVSLLDVVNKVQSSFFSLCEEQINLTWWAKLVWDATDGVQSEIKS